MPKVSFSPGTRAALVAAGLVTAAILLVGLGGDVLAQDIADVFKKAEDKAEEFTKTIVRFVRIVAVIVIIALGIWMVAAGWNRTILIKGIAAVFGLILVAYADQIVGWFVAGTAIASGSG